MMFGGKDDPLHACLLAYSCPLPTIEMGRIEQIRVFITVSPFLISIGVQRVVNKSVHFHLLPT